MQGLGDRMRARARELGISDSEVARRSNLGQTAYANYVSDRHEPNLPTFLRICAVLGASPNDLLGRQAGVPQEVDGLRERVTATMAAMDAATLALLARVADGLVATAGRPGGAKPVGRPALPRRKAPAPGDGASATE
jgi:transcriptional regulator with XRE-family HTH domain